MGPPQPRSRYAERHRLEHRARNRCLPGSRVCVEKGAPIKGCRWRSPELTGRATVESCRCRSLLATDHLPDGTDVLSPTRGPPHLEAAGQECYGNGWNDGLRQDARTTQGQLQCKGYAME